MNTETQDQRHPSFGMVGFGRRQSSGSVLVGSSLKQTETIVLTVHTASLRRELSHDWWYAREPIVEVEMSPVQFAELLTSMNVGDGVPCTIRHITGRGDMPEPPAPDGHRTIAHQEFKETCRDAVAHLDKLTELAKGVKQVGQQKALLDAIAMAKQEIESNLPFVEKSFVETTEKTVAEAKATVDAFVTGMIHRTGLEALRGAVQLQDGCNQIRNHD